MKQRAISITLSVVGTDDNNNRHKYDSDVKILTSENLVDIFNRINGELLDFNQEPDIITKSLSNDIAIEDIPF